MAIARQIKAIDTYVDAAKPNTNFSTSPRLGLRRHDSSAPKYAYVTFWNPFPIGAKITRATLEVETYAMPEAGAHGLYVVPVTSNPHGFSRLTHANRPTDDVSRVVRVTKSGALPGAQRWSFDVTEFVQAVSDGQPWYGWRIATDDANVDRWIYSRENTSTAGDGPRLTVEYADEPAPPDSLSPHEGVVGSPKPGISFDYVDFGGDTTLSKVRIQTASMATSFAAPTWDSGEIGALKPTIYLSDTSYPGATAGQRVYYRVKARDGDGLWSGWSPVAWFIYQPVETLTVLSPIPSAPKFTDSTPDITWLQSGIQTAYQVTIHRTDRPQDVLWNTGKVGGSQRSVGVPSGVLRWDDRQYTLVVRTWDDKSRVRSPGALPYNRVELVVSFDQDASATPVTNVTVKKGAGPTVEVRWQRASSADAYEIARQIQGSEEKVIVGTISHAEAIRQDGTYRFIDRTSPGNLPVRHIVRPVTNGKRAGGIPSAYVTHPFEGVWLVDADGNQLMIAGDDQGAWSMPENETAHQVIGARAPVIVRELRRGYEGSMTGLLIEEDRYQPGMTARDKYELFLRFKKGLREPRMVAGDQNIPVRLAAMNAYPTPYWDLRYECSFNFWQYAEVWWEKL